MGPMDSTSTFGERKRVLDSRVCWLRGDILVNLVEVVVTSHGSVCSFTVIRSYYLGKKFVGE